MRIILIRTGQDEKYGNFAACYETDEKNAAKEMQISVAEIEWSIENYGRCDVGEWIAIPKEPYEAPPFA